MGEQVLQVAMNNELKGQPPVVHPAFSVQMRSTCHLVISYLLPIQIVVKSAGDPRMSFDQLRSLAVGRFGGQVEVIPPEDLTFGRLIGRGGYGKVFHAVWHQAGGDTDVAVKTIKASHESVDIFFDEIRRVMAAAASPFFCHLLGVSLRKGYPALVLELFETDLHKLVELRYKKEGMRPDQAARIALQVARGLEFLHSQEAKLVHQDIKPGNILVSRDLQRFVISDLGLSVALTSSLNNVRSGQVKGGTAYYMASPQKV